MRLWNHVGPRTIAPLRPALNGVQLVVGPDRLCHVEIGQDPGLPGEAARTDAGVKPRSWHSPDGPLIDRRLPCGDRHTKDP
jgi:hypothetical protein